MRLKKLLLTVAIGVILLGACAAPSAPPAERPTPTPMPTPEKTPTPTPTPAPTPAPTPTAMVEMQQIMNVEAEGVILHYQRESFWNEDAFSVILEDKGKFSSKLTEKLINDVSKHGEGREQAANANVRFDEGSKSTILRCDIRGAVWESGDSYHATFFWLLRPLGLDFIDNDFDESEKGLFWQGTVSGVPTTIAVKLPTINGSVYKAWAYPVGHCHAHAWWPVNTKQT